MIQSLLEKKKKCGLGNAEFAKVIGISRVHWYRLRTGKSAVTADLAARLAKEFSDLKPEALKEMGLSDESSI